jgi:ABC-type transport system substrate-binding protein
LLLFAINDPPYDASFAYARFPSTALPGAAHWNSPQFDQLWNAQLKEFDTTKREQELQQMSQLMFDDAGAVFLYQSPHVYAMKKTVKWTPGPGSVLWFDDATKG